MHRTLMLLTHTPGAKQPGMLGSLEMKLFLSQLQSKVSCFKVYLSSYKWLVYFHSWETETFHPLLHSSAAATTGRGRQQPQLGARSVSATGSGRPSTVPGCTGQGVQLGSEAEPGLQLWHSDVDVYIPSGNSAIPYNFSPKLYMMSKTAVSILLSVHFSWHLCLWLIKGRVVSSEVIYFNPV